MKITFEIDHDNPVLVPMLLSIAEAATRLQAPVSVAPQVAPAATPAPKAERKPRQSKAEATAQLAIDAGLLPGVKVEAQPVQTDLEEAIAEQEAANQPEPVATSPEKPVEPKPGSPAYDELLDNVRAKIGALPDAATWFIANIKGVYNVNNVSALTAGQLAEVWEKVKG